MSTTRVFKGAHEITGTLQADGTITLNAGAWNTAHLVFGTYHVWMGTSVLRIKSSAPGSADDGDPIANMTAGTITQAGDIEIQNQVDATVPLRVKGTASQSGDLLQLSNSTGGTHYIAVSSTGLTTINGGAYNSGHIVLGSYHLWIDSAGDLRIKSSAPGSALDGSPAGITNTNRQIIGPWYWENLGASQAQTTMNLGSDAGSDNFEAIRDGSVTGLCIYVRGTEARTAGTATVNVIINGITETAAITLSASNTTSNRVTWAKGTYTFSAGETIAAYIASSSWAPTTADVKAFVEIET